MTCHTMPDHHHHYHVPDYYYQLVLISLDMDVHINAVSAHWDHPCSYLPGHNAYYIPTSALFPFETSC